MDKVMTGIILLFILAVGVFFFFARRDTMAPLSPSSPRPSIIISPDEDAPLLTVIAEHLDTPWAIAFLPDRSMLVTERSGTVRRIASDGSFQPQLVATLSQVREIGEGGLMGMALHPAFESNTFVYLYYTYSGAGNDTLNRVVRMTYENGALVDEEIIVDAIPGAPNHNGGRIAFGPEDMLYITTGDAQEPSQAQDTSSLAGKILRVTPEGDPAPGNPFGNEVYSYGHRNPQGLAWDRSGQLWATEHGRSGVQSGFDELNLIERGANYGWPTIQGDETQSGMQPPITHSGATNTWAPAGAVVADDSLFFVGLRGQALYEAVLSGRRVADLKEHFSGEYGRLRAIVQGPEGMLYSATSNRDGRGSPTATDDRIIRINPAKLTSL